MPDMLTEAERHVLAEGWRAFRKRFAEVPLNEAEFNSGVLSRAQRLYEGDPEVKDSEPLLLTLRRMRFAELGLVIACDTLDPIAWEALHRHLAGGGGARAADGVGRQDDGARSGVALEALSRLYLESVAAGRAPFERYEGVARLASFLCGVRCNQLRSTRREGGRTYDTGMSDLEQTTFPHCSEVLLEAENACLLSRALDQALEGITQRQREVLAVYQRTGFIQAAAARELGLARPSVSMHLANIWNNLRVNAAKVGLSLGPSDRRANLRVLAHVLQQRLSILAPQAIRRRIVRPRPF